MTFDAIYKLSSNSKKQKKVGKNTFSEKSRTFRRQHRIITNLIRHAILREHNLKCHTYSPELQMYLNRPW
jgi:hypothetical protein